MSKELSEADYLEGNYEPELCPMGCGRTTEDPYGGPCSKCWDNAPSDESDYPRSNKGPFAPF